MTMAVMDPVVAKAGVGVSSGGKALPGVQVDLSGAWRQDLAYLAHS